jgi:hypothetical protein
MYAVKWPEVDNLV